MIASLKEHAIEIISFIKREMIPLTSEEHKSYIKRQKSATFVIKSLRINLPTIKNTVKLEIIVIIPAVHIVYVI